MTRLQALGTLIILLIGFAALTWGFFKIMVIVFKQLNKRHEQ
jgi:uncharacterized membrane protein